MHFVALSPDNTVVVRLTSVGLSAVCISDGDADDPRGLALVTPDDLFLEAIDHLPDWFVVSVPTGSLLLGAHPGQGRRSLSSQC